jgi:hypothetical protein
MRRLEQNLVKSLARWYGGAVVCNAPLEATKPQGGRFYDGLQEAMNGPEPEHKVVDNNIDQLLR